MGSNFKSIFIGLIVLIAGGCTVFFARELALSKVQPVSNVADDVQEFQEDDSNQVKPKGKIVTVVFSSNLESGGDCHDHYTDGCDLFSAQVDLSTGEASDLKQITNNDLADTFPVLSRDGKTVYYTESTDGHDNAMLISIDGGTATLISKEASHPSPSPDGNDIYFVLRKAFTLAKFSDGVIEKIEDITSAHEVHVSLNGLLAFYRTSGGGRKSGTSQPMIYNPNSGELIEVSEANGTAHCFWNYDGSSLYCNNRRDGGIISFPIAEDGSAGEYSVAIPFPSYSKLAEVDSRFDKSCIITSVEYGSFCDDNHVMLSAACYTADQVDGEQEQKFTSVVIYNLESKKFLPMGRNIIEEDPEIMTWSAACADTSGI